MTFDGDIPVELANKILLMDPNTYTEELDENGHSVYYSTPFKTYKEALEAQQNYINEGFDKAIVVAYHKYNEISIEKAKAIKGE
jgi:hypothetical protein